MALNTDNPILKLTGLRITHFFLFNILSLFVLFSLILYSQDVSAGQITLAWNPPTTNAAGAPLRDLVGYKVYCGTASRVYSQVIDVGNTTTYTIGNPTGETYYLAVTAYDAAGNQSAYSNEVSNALQAAVPASQQSFVIDPPVVTPVINSVPAQAAPIGIGPIAAGGSMVSVVAGLSQFSGPVDIYFGVYAPAIDPVNIYILTPTGFETLANAGLVPWMSNTRGGINYPFFENIPTSVLPAGTYTFYLVVTPAGSIDTFYFWETNFML